MTFVEVKTKASIQRRARDLSTADRPTNLALRGLNPVLSFQFFNQVFQAHRLSSRSKKDQGLNLWSLNNCTMVVLSMGCRWCLP
jgi:hypothetical protein